MIQNRAEYWLAHYGVKGMKWGVTRSVNLVDDRTGAKTPIKFNPKKVQVGKNADGSLSLNTNSSREQDRIHKQAFKDKKSDDFQKTETSKSIARSAGTKSLSNKELQDLVTRMNLEQQYSRLKPPTVKKKAGQFVGKMLLDLGKQQLNSIAQDQARKQVAKVLGGR